MNKKDIKINMPEDVRSIIETLQHYDYEAYIVGGCVRDSLLGRMPSDWDITTNAEPKEVIDMFKGLEYKVLETGLKHGTVTVVINSIGYEITTFRIDGKYEDNRHPKEVSFTNSLKEDLSRRDFTINAMAYNDEIGLVDYFNGFEDLGGKIITTVGHPKDRFNEDALRMLRAIRFSSQLNFYIDFKTCYFIRECSENIQSVSNERIRDEMCKIITSDYGEKGIRDLVATNLMNYIIPELNCCVGFNQHNKYHDKDVFNHIIDVVTQTSFNNLELRLSALLHDIGKPKCFSLDENNQGHFYEHAKVSADMSREILTRLKFDNKTIDKVCKLVYNHMTPTDLNDKSIKKLINRVGKDSINDLINLMIADRMGHVKECMKFSDIFELRKKVDEIINEKQPLTVKDLKINGYDLMELGIKQGKDIGIILNKLLEIVLENPELNNKESLIKTVKKVIRKEID